MQHITLRTTRLLAPSRHSDGMQQLTPHATLCHKRVTDPKCVSPSGFASSATCVVQTAAPLPPVSAPRLKKAEEERVKDAEALGEKEKKEKKKKDKDKKEKK